LTKVMKLSAGIRAPRQAVRPAIKEQPRGAYLVNLTPCTRINSSRYVGMTIWQIIH